MLRPIRDAEDIRITLCSHKGMTQNLVAKTHEGISVFSFLTYKPATSVLLSYTHLHLWKMIYKFEN
jgi:hypothetical protein